MDLSSQLLQLLFSGLTLGSIYSLIALALVATYNITGVLNLAQGEFVALGALLAASIYAAGLPLAAAFLVSVALIAALGALIERSVIYPARESSALTLIIITVGLSISLRGLALLVWGTEPVSLPAFSSGGPLLLGGAFVNPQTLWILGMAAATTSGLYIFFELTYTGKAVRACVINRTAALLIGINPGTISLLAFAGSDGAAAGLYHAGYTATYEWVYARCKGFVTAAIGVIFAAPFGGFSVS